MTTSRSARDGVLRRFRTPREVGALIRDVRTARGWTQADLAERAGVGRQWLVAVEHGRRSGAELGLVLRVLGALNVELAATVVASPSDEGTEVSEADGVPRQAANPPTVDLDALLDDFTGRSPR